MDQSKEDNSSKTFWDVEEYKVISSLLKSPGFFSPSPVRSRLNTFIQQTPQEKTPGDWLTVVEETIYGHYKAALKHIPNPTLDDLPHDLLRRLLKHLFDQHARNWLE